MTSIRQCFVLLSAGLLTLGCVDAEGDYNDFKDRYEQTSGSGGAGGEAGQGGAAGAAGAAPCVVPSPGEMDGDYLFALSAKVKPEAPLLFTNKVTTTASGSDLSMQWTLQGLDRFDRKTPVGDPIVLDPTVIGSDGTIDIALPPLNVTGQANPISGSNITAEVKSLRGSFCNTDGFYCGQVDGDVTKPIPLNINGSTWSMQKIDDPNAYPPPVLDCKKTPAGPPPTK